MKDIDIKIDGRNLSVKKETSVLQASQVLGIKIPTLCFSKKAKGNSGCMVCLVWDNLTQKYLPACETECRPEMNIVTDSQEISLLRRQTIELLLSEHQGACEAPCDIVCRQKIPLSGFTQSINGLVENPGIEFDPTICEQCKGKCERVCRRARFDHAIPIRTILNERAKKTTKELTGHEKTPKPYNHRFRNPTPEDLKIMAGHSSIKSGDLTIEKEAARCLRCDCTAKNKCTLRELADRFQARQFTFRNENPEPFQIINTGKIVFEPTKCVRCGRCVSLGKILKPDQGPIMSNRGKHTRVTPPFGMNYQEIFSGFEQEFIDECPTGALHSPAEPTLPLVIKAANQE